MSERLNRLNVMKISIKFNCASVSFRFSVALLILCLKDLSIDMNGVLKSFNISLDFSLYSILRLISHDENSMKYMGLVCISYQEL